MNETTAGLRSLGLQVGDVTRMFEANPACMRISDFLDEASHPARDYSLMLEALNSAALRSAVAELVNRNVEFIRRGSSLATHRGDLADSGVRPLSSTYLLSKPSGYLILVEFDPKVVNLGELAASARVGNFSGKDLLIKVIAGGPLHLRRFSTQQVSDDTDFGSPLPTEVSRETLTEESPPMLFRGCSSSYKVERVETIVTCLMLFVNRSDLSVKYNVADQGSVGEIASNDHSLAALIVAMDQLALRAPSQASATLARFVDYPAFFVRWHAIRRLAQVDPQAAALLLERRLRDERNPLVRSGLQKLHSYVSS